MIHIVAVAEPFQALCEAPDIYIFNMTWLHEEKEGWTPQEPTCETCILIHFAEPERTHRMTG